MRLQSYYQKQYDLKKAKGRWATAAELPPDQGMEIQLPADGMWLACAEGLCIRQDAKIEKN